MYYWKSCCKIELCIGTGSKLYRLLPEKLNLNQTVHFFIHSLPSKVYRFLSASAKQIHIKLHSVNTQSWHDLEQRALLTGESADLDKWANVTMQSRLSSAAEARPCCLYVLSFGDGCGGFGLVLLLSLMAGSAPATFDGWLNAKTLGRDLQGSCETVSLPSCSAAELWLTALDKQMT